MQFMSKEYNDSNYCKMISNTKTELEKINQTQENVFYFETDTGKIKIGKGEAYVNTMYYSIPKNKKSIITQDSSKDYVLEWNLSNTATIYIDGVLTTSYTVSDKNVHFLQSISQGSEITIID